MKADLNFVPTGIYVPPTAQFPKHFHDIGVRIEDEVVVGERHPTVLTVSAPKEVSSVARRDRAPMHRRRVSGLSMLTCLSFRSPTSRAHVKGCSAWSRTSTGLREPR